MFEQLKELNVELETTKPATAADIELIERELSITLGNEYKSFLTEFGTLEVEYFEFYGIFKDNKSLPSAIYATKYAREKIENFPKNLIVFYETGDGSFYCVDQEDNVFLCNYNRCNSIEKSFKEFIFEKIGTLLDE
jgi:hypothetical protein